MDEFVPGVEKDEALYAELSELGRELGVPVVQARVGLTVVDAEGVQLSDVEHRSRTWTRNFWNQMMVIFGSATAAGYTGGTTFGAGSLYLKNVLAATAGTFTAREQQTYNPFSFWRDDGVTGANGLMVGSGTTAESFEHTALATKIAHGTGAGQLSYGALSRGVVTYSSGTKTWASVLTRLFTNASGGAVSVNEVGLYANTAGNYMMCRDKLGAQVDVPNGAVLTLRYTLSLVFPA